MATANKVVAPFIGQPWLEYDPDLGPSVYAVEVGLPAEHAHAQDYPLAPGVELDFLDDTTPATMTRQDLTVPASGQRMYLYQAVTPEHPDDRRVVYYLHGGGFIRGNGKYCRSVGLWIQQQLGLPTYVGEYTTADVEKWPRNLDDAEAGWNYLTQDLGLAPENIVCLGDSAGGMLFGALGMRLKRQGRPLPGAMIFLSAAIDYTFTLPSQTENALTDPLFAPGVPPESVDWWADSAHRADPELSSYQGDWTGFPPLYFAAGDLEVWLSDSLETAKKAYEAGVRPVVCHIFTGMWHDWIVGDHTELPESARVAADWRKFLGLSRPDDPPAL